MEIRNQSYYPAFQARPDKRLLKRISREFGGDNEKINKFVDLFQKTHNYLDENTVIELNKDDNYVISHTGFQNIAYQRGKILRNKPVSTAELLITECPKVFGYSEDLLFKNIVRRLLQNNMSFDEIEETGTKVIKNQKNLENFKNTVKTARRMVQENPDTKFDNIDFEIMENKIIQEEIKTEGTKMYNFVHGLALNLGV